MTWRPGLWALDRLIDDRRQDRPDDWDGKFAKFAHKHLPAFILERRHRIRREARDAAERESRAKDEAKAASKAAAEEPQPTAPVPAPELAPLLDDPETRKILAALSERIGQSRYSLWFAGKTHFERTENGLTVYVANLVLHDWLRKTFAADIEAVAGVRPNFVINSLFGAARAVQSTGRPHETETTE